MINPRFKVGDIIDIVRYWDNCDGCNQYGVILITEFNPARKHSPQGTYSIEVLKGNITFIAYSVKYFDKLPYLAWLGNINDNTTLKLLYGK